MNDADSVQLHSAPSFFCHLPFDAAQGERQQYPSPFVLSLSKHERCEFRAIAFRAKLLRHLPFDAAQGERLLCLSDRYYPFMPRGP